MPWVTSSTNGVKIQVKVQPRSSKNEIIGITGDFLRVRLTAPPVEGEANKALVKYLGQVFGCAVGRIKILRGATGRCKLVEIIGLTEEAVRQQLNRCCRERV
ncbi:MAG: DUF167 domain-containing protein [Thermacetogeniaceae bacterium]|jgi:uncharacterized protein (TIGR00251 family)|nr:YggU family protein [Syntrophomonadaceae bacterium]